jgi:hypothetical protein
MAEAGGPPEWIYQGRKAPHVALSSSRLALPTCKTQAWASVADADSRKLKRQSAPGDGHELYVPTEWLKDHDPALFGLRLARPADDPGRPPIRTVSGAKGSWVRESELRATQVPGVDDLLHECALAKTLIKCTWDANDTLPVKQRPSFMRPTERFVPLHVVRRRFPFLRLRGDVDPIPVSALYTFAEDTRSWIPETILGAYLEETEIDDLAESGKKRSPSGARFGIVLSGLRAEGSTARVATAFRFFDAALVAARAPDLRALVHGLVDPAAVQPLLPAYTVLDDVSGDPLAGLYVSMCSLRRLAEADPELREIFAPAVVDADDDDDPAPISDTAAAKRVVLDGHVSARRDAVTGALVKIGGGNTQGSIMLSVARIERHPLLRRLSPLIAPGHPTLPIELSSPPTRNMGSDPVKVVMKLSKISTIKIAAKSVIADYGRVAPVLKHLVANVSRSSRYGSLLMQLHLLRLLDEGQGVLAATFPLTATTIRNAMAFARTSNHPDPVRYRSLGVTDARYADILSHLKVDYIPRITNTSVTEATQFLTGTMNSISNHGEARVAAIFRNVTMLHGCWSKALVGQLTGHVRDGTALTEGVDPAVARYAVDYRKLYVDKGLDGAFKFDLNRLKDDQQLRRASRIFELFYKINADLVALEDAAIATGRWKRGDGDRPSNDRTAGIDHDFPLHDDYDDDTEDAAIEALLATAETTPSEIKVWPRRAFSLLPVNTLRMRHIRIDNNVWAGHLFDELYDLDIDGLEVDAFDSLFKKDDPKYRKFLGGLRSAKKGWLLGPSFTTDGTTVQQSFYNPRIKATKEEKLRHKGRVDPEDAFRPLPEGAMSVGIDAGVVNILEAAWEWKGAVHHMTYTSKQHYELGHVNKVQRASAARALAARVELAALSRTRKKTGVLTEFAQYVRVAGEGHDALWGVLGAPAAAWDRFETHRFKAKAFDGFFRRLLRAMPNAQGPGTPKVAVVLAWGNASFNGSLPGNKSVPTKSMVRRVRATMGGDFDTRDVDEMRTTITCSQCERRLQVGQRWRRGKRGNFGWLEDRDVKWCTTPQCLESHPCSAPKKLIIGARGPEGATPVARDTNSAHSHAKLVGKRNADRPVAFRR